MASEPRPYGAGEPPRQPPPVQAAEVRKRGALFWIAGILAILFFFSTIVLFVACLFLGAALTARETHGKFVKHTVSGAGEDEILMLPVEGMITSLGAEDLFGNYPGTVEWVREQLKQAREDANIRGVILSIDSPGGEISACDAIYQEILKYRTDSNQKVVAFMRDTAASGGYYIACTSDRIVASPTTITGSIGVIMPLVSFYGLLNKIGVEIQPLTSGPRKDIGAGYRPVTAEERNALQGIVNELYEQFLHVAAQGFTRRGVAMSEERLRALADGMVYTGNRAKELRLVDAVGYYDDAVAAAQSLAGLSEAKVVTYRPRPGLLGFLLGGGEGRAAPHPGLAATSFRADTPRFMYLWTAGQGILLSSAQAARAALP